jgi:hypothetical protein
MSSARLRFGNTCSHGNEQTRKTIASQRLAKHTLPWQRIKQSNTRIVGGGDLYSVRLEVSSVQESLVARDSSLFGIRKRVQLSAVEC